MSFKHFISFDSWKGLYKLYGFGICIINCINFDQNPYYKKYENDPKKANIIGTSLIGMSILKGTLYAMFAPLSICRLALDMTFLNIDEINTHFVPGSKHNQFLKGLV